MQEEYSSNGIGYYAMRLALTRTLAEENELKQKYRAKGLSFAVTETGAVPARISIRSWGGRS